MGKYGGICAKNCEIVQNQVQNWWDGVGPLSLFHIYFCTKIWGFWLLGGMVGWNFTSPTCKQKKKKILNQFELIHKRILGMITTSTTRNKVLIKHSKFVFLNVWIENLWTLKTIVQIKNKTKTFGIFWNNSIFECLNWKLMNIEKWNKW